MGLNFYDNLAHQSMGYFMSLTIIQHALAITMNGTVTSICILLLVFELFQILFAEFDSHKQVQYFIYCS